MQLRLFRVARLIGAFVSLFAIIVQAAPVEDQPLLGFSSAGSTAERELEKRFDSTLRAEDLRVWLKRLSARPHHVGSPYGKENAEFIASQFKSWGFDTQIEEFSVLFPTPKTRIVELISPEKFTAKAASLSSSRTAILKRSYVPSKKAITTTSTSSCRCGCDDFVASREVLMIRRIKSGLESQLITDLPRTNFNTSLKVNPFGRQAC